MKGKMLFFDFEGLRLSEEQAELLTVFELVELLELRQLECRRGQAPKQ